MLTWRAACGPMVSRCLPAFFLLLVCLPESTVAGAPQHGLAKLIDEVITTQRFLDDIPGASVAVVRDGETRHLGGYGYADTQRSIPVSADHTLFGTGSVSKLFTWTAVMQLVEQGRLALDRDINSYLDGFQIPATWPQPVTLAHLLTHTAGFEDRNIGFYARHPGDLVPLGAFLARRMPARIYPPGQVSAYSNYGAALAGHIVAEVAAMPFESYVEQHIFTPLGMTRSSFRQPLPVALLANQARGSRGEDAPTGRTWYQARPSGALYATAADMGRFMLAHLQQGRLHDRQILAPATAQMMQQRQFSNHPEVSGLTYGFQELQRGGRRILWQRGDTLYFTAAVMLVPELRTGVFVAYNHAGVGHAPLELLDAILSRSSDSYPAPSHTPPASPFPTSELTGMYRSTRSNGTGPEKLLKPFRPVRVHTHAPGILRISGLAMGGDTLWVEQTPLRYRAIDSQEYVIFRSGQPNYLFEGNMPAAGYYRLPWYGVPRLHAILLGACTLVFLATLPGGFWWMWRHSHGSTTPDNPLRLVSLVAVGLSACNLALIISLWVLMSNVLQLLFGETHLLRLVMLLAWVSLLMTVLTMVLTLHAWLTRTGSIAGRLHLSLATVAGLVFLWMLIYWRLV